MKQSLFALTVILLATSSAHAWNSTTAVDLRASCDRHVSISERGRADLSNAITASGLELAPGEQVVVTLDGYFVRPGGTTAVLRQLGGRDVARGSVSVTAADGTIREAGSFSIALRSEGSTVTSHSARMHRLHGAVAKVVLEKLRS